MGLGKIGFIIIGLGLSFSAHAFDPFYYSFHYKNEKLRFHFESMPTASGEVESIVSLVEERLLFPNSEHAILFGRDLDSDGFPETWFFRGIRYAVTEVFVISPPDQPSDDPAGKSALLKIIPYIEENLENRSVVGLALGKTAEFLSFAISASEQAGRDYFSNQLDLYELRERALKSKNPEVKRYILGLFEQGWRENDAALLAVTHSGATLAYSAADLATFGLAGRAIRLVEKGGIWVAKKTGLNRLGTKLAETYLIRSISQAALKAEINTTLRGLAIQKKFIQDILEVTGRHAKKVTHRGAVSVLTIYQHGVHGWQYILQTQLMQILAEGAARWDEIYDPNPIVLSKNLFGDKGFLQNFLYMTNETTLMTGISMREKTFGKKLMLCGLMAAGDSAAMNFLVKGGVDPKRAVLDSGWEVVTGSLQTIFDTHMIHHFHEAALKQKNPKLKLIGYAIAMVDQAAGYYTYSKITQKMTVIPVTVEEP